MNRRVRNIMKHVIKIENYIEGYKIYTLDVICKDLDKHVQLISSKEGKELASDISYLRKAILATR